MAQTKRQKSETLINRRFSVSKDSKISSDRADINEKTIEQQMVSAVKAAGGICPKLICPGMNGMPDRLVLLPGCHVAFVEVKAPGKKPRTLQTRRHKQLRKLGFPVFVLDDIGSIGRILKEVKEWQM